MKNNLIWDQGNWDEQNWSSSSGYEETYLKSNTLNSDLLIEIKRINQDGIYEAEWQDISSLIPNPSIVQNSISAMSYKLENESFSYGVLRVPDCTLKLLSINGEFDSEANYNSIFYGYVRHKTLVRISHGYLDTSSSIYDYVEVYRGFINEKSNNTKVSNDNTYQDLFIEDLLTFLLKDYTFSDFTITATTLEAFLFELFNRPEFTDFLTVNALNITAGYNIQNIDDTTLEGQTQWIKILQDLSIGHSHLYQKAGVLYYKPIAPQNNTAKLFDRNKIIQVENVSSGIDEVFEKLFWEDTAISFISPTNIYNQTKTFKIPTITNATDQNNILATIGTRTAAIRKKITISVVLFCNLFILDRIRIDAGDYETNDGLVWDQGNWDEQNWSSNLGAAFTQNSSFWMIKEIKHNFQSGSTELLVEEV